MVQNPSHLHVGIGKIRVVGKARSKNTRRQNHEENKGWDARHESYKTIWQIVNEPGAAYILTRVITD